MPRDNARDSSSKQSTRSNNGALLHASPEKAINQMMETIDALRDVYVQENKALDAVDTKAFLALQDSKIETAKLYEQSISEILERRDEMKRIDPSLKRRLRKMQQDFSALAVQNRTALDRMKRTAERLNKTLCEATKDAVNKHRVTSYGESGALDHTKKRMVSAGISETA